MTDTATPPTADAAQKARPEKPDEAKYKADLAKAEKDHEAAQARFNASRTKLDSARPGKSTPANDRFKALVDDQKAIRAKQQENKNAKKEQQDKFNKNDNDIKKLIAEQKETRGRLNFRNVDELEAKVASIERQIESGTLKVVDEKKSLAEIREIRKQKPKFAEAEQLQKDIDAKKAENAELKKTFDNPESRALAQKYEDNQKELDEIKAAREDTNKNYDTLKAEREKLYQEQQATYANIRKVKDDYFAARKAHKEHEDQLYQQRRERQKAERDAYEKEKRRRIAEQKLEEAGEPAYLDQIRTAEGLIRYFDPSYSTGEGDKGPGQFAASAQRTIDDAGFKGMKVVKKEDEDFFVGSGGKKKGGKGKKGGAATAPESGKFNLNIGIIEELARVGVDPPSTQADAPSVVEKLKQKVEVWKKDQDSQTQKNIEKAKKEIEKLEKEAEEAAAATPSTSGRRTHQAKKPALKETGVNGGPTADAEEAAEKDGLADATKELKEASIEDKENATVETA